MIEGRHREWWFAASRGQVGFSRDIRGTGALGRKATRSDNVGDLNDSRTEGAVTTTVAQMRRYPVKSMRGEDVDRCELTERGLLGDRGYALVDAADGRVVSAKNPRKWPGILDCHARYVTTPRLGEDLPPVEVTLPDGTLLRSDAPTAAGYLSRAFGREVVIGRIPPVGKSLEEYWPAVEGLTPIGEPVANEHGDTITALPVAMLAPEGTFFDLAAIHLVTTATIDRLRALYPTGRFDVRRFRPNLLVATEPTVTGFVENDWIGRTIWIGEQVQLKVIDPCPRCVMTTLPQGDLEADPGILRTIARHNPVTSATLMPGEVLAACVGVYASVLKGGVVRCGDTVRLL